jgi:NADH-quinone oxidoreductase subunit N
MITLLAEIKEPFIPTWAGEYGLRAFAPELIVIGTIIAVLLAPFFSRRSNVLCAVVSLIGLAMALGAALLIGVDDDVTGTHFRGLLVADHFAVMWKCLLYLFVIGVIVMWFSTTSVTMHEGDGPEFFTLLLGATLGMSLMASTSNLLMIFMCVELASLPSYVLAGFRKTDRVGAEASLKYVLFGAATSAVMVYGLSMLYGLYGTLQVEQLAVRMTQTSGGGTALLATAIFGLIVGIGFKISAVPFHFWCPDVFEGASIDVSAFLSVASKGAALALLLRVLMLMANAVGFQDAPGLSLTAIAVVIGIIGSVTATVGNLAAFVQLNIKRLLAYSSIAHAGYMLCALSLLIQYDRRAGEMPVWESAPQAILLYLAVYLFMNLGAFTVAGLIGRETGNETLDEYEGLARRSPLLAIAMGAFMFSLVGLPPFAGFIAKLNVMYVLGANGGWWWALVAVIGVNTIVSLYYYLRVVKVMYLSTSQRPVISPNPLGLGLALLCAAMLLVMLVAYQPVARLTTEYGQLHLPERVASPAPPAAAPTTRTASVPVAP